MLFFGRRAPRAAAAATALPPGPIALAKSGPAAMMDKVSAGGIADLLVILSASATGGSTAVAGTAVQGIAGQTPFTLVTPNGPVSLPIGHVQAIAASTSAN